MTTLRVVCRQAIKNVSFYSTVINDEYSQTFFAGEAGGFRVEMWFWRGALFFCFVLFTLLFIFKAFMNLTSSISFGQSIAKHIMRTIIDKRSRIKENESTGNTSSKAFR